MGNGFPIFEIVLLGMIAAFLILRLKNTLGRRTGHEQEEPRSRFGMTDRAKESRGDDNVIPMHGRDRETPVADIPADDGSDRLADMVPADDAPAVEKGLYAIRQVDRTFDKAGFSQGASAAYEMIVTAFAKGDRAELKPLLAPKVYESFESAISAREAAGQTQETTVVGVRRPEIVEAELTDSGIAEVTVKFTADMISATKDSEGRIIAGDVNEVTTLTEIWTFARDTGSRDPNWELIATRTSH